MPLVIIFFYMEAKRVPFILVVRDLCAAIGVARAIVYLLAGVVFALLSYIVEVREVSYGGLMEAMAAFVGLSFTAFTIMMTVKGNLNTLFERAKDKKYPIREMFAVFAISMILHLIGISVLMLPGDRETTTWNSLVLGIFGCCIISVADITLQFFCLYTSLVNGINVGDEEQEKKLCRTMFVYPISHFCNHYTLYVA